MIRLERVTPSDFERVLPLFAHFNNPNITRDRWRSLFEYSWPCDDDTRGCMLVDEDRVVGYFGVILYERMIDGRLEKFGNFSSWITLPEYRGHALTLFDALASIEGRTLSCVSPRPELMPLYMRFGFRVLESKALILYPLPSFSTPSAWFQYKATTNPDKIRERLEPPDRDLFDHHRPHPCGHLLIYNSAEYCYIIFSRTKGRRFHFANIHHIGNVPVFVKNLDRVRLHLTLAAKALFVMIESRLLPPIHPRFSRLAQFGHSQVYKSDTLRPDQIDGLYTEAILLNL